MSITGAFILYAVTWFMVFFCVLPLRITSQQMTGEVVPGTPKSAPADHLVGKKAIITTFVTLGLWVAMVAFIFSGVVSIRDIDLFHLMPRG